LVLQRSKFTLRPQYERGKFCFWVNASYIELLRASVTTRISGMERVRTAHHHLQGRTGVVPAAAAAAAAAATATSASTTSPSSSSSAADEEEQLDPKTIEPSFYDLMYDVFFLVFLILLPFFFIVVLILFRSL
jgi:hypothetical protein